MASELCRVEPLLDIAVRAAHYNGGGTAEREDLWQISAADLKRHEWEED